MIVLENSRPTLAEFVELMKLTDEYLNKKAIENPDYFANRGGVLLEDDVKDALDECAKGTPFENSIQKISGQKFPDIVAAHFFGVEVKSTKEDHWKTTGSSILESSRVPNVERIFLTFGKLGGNSIEFISRPYEECLYDIAVTHMPRYLIDMKLEHGKTIFDKMGVSYNDLRKMNNPVEPVSKYYRSQLKPGESLWWTGDNANETVSAKIKLWNNLSKNEKHFFTTYGCVNFPEVFKGQYDRYALWLTSRGVVDSHIRDQFSAGGQEKIPLLDGSVASLPGVYRRVKENLDVFLKIMSQQNTHAFFDSEIVDDLTLSKRLFVWSDEVSRFAKVDYCKSMAALKAFFSSCHIDFSFWEH